MANTHQDLRGPAESKNLTFQIIWPATYHGNFHKAKSGGDSLVMAQAQVGVTWQMHHDDEPEVDTRASRSSSSANTPTTQTGMRGCSRSWSVVRPPG